MKILAIDIETSPNLADVWGLWNNNVSLSQLRESQRMLCFAWQWEGDKQAHFCAEWLHKDRDTMVRHAWEVLNEADAVIHYNGQRFDVPHLNREMLQAGHTPPSPYKQIDLLREVKNAFSFPSYKLAYVAPALGVGEKVEHEGHELWVKVMAGDRKARQKMAEYNRRDVELLFPLYYKLRPWTASGLSHGAFTGEDVCPWCGSDDLMRNGYAYTLTGRYQRYQCRGCGAYPRATRRDQATGLTRVAS